MGVKPGHCPGKYSWLDTRAELITDSRTFLSMVTVGIELSEERQELSRLGQEQDRWWHRDSGQFIGDYLIEIIIFTCRVKYEQPKIK